MWNNPSFCSSGLAASVAAVLEACAPRISIGPGRVITPAFAPDRSLMTLVPDAVDGVPIEDEALVLCRGQRPDRCVLATGYLTGFEAHQAGNIPQAAIEAIVIAPTEIDGLMAGSRAIRALVFRAYSQRMAEMLAPIGPSQFMPAPPKDTADLAAILRDAKPFGLPV